MPAPLRDVPKAAPDVAAAVRRVVGRARGLAGARLEFPYRAAPTPAVLEPPAKPARDGADYDTAWARRYPARVARLALTEGVLRPVARVVAQPTRHGLDRIARVEGPVVFAPNHASHLDTGLLITSLPERFRHKVVVAAAADYFFTNQVSSAAAALVINAIPLERTKVGRRSANLASSLIDEGWNLIIYPEGGRSPDGWGQPFRGGAAWVAQRCGVPVVPVHLGDTGKLLPRGGKTLKPGKTTVTFGDPIVMTDGEDPRRLAARIEAAVAALADEATTDWYTARRRAYAGESPTLTGPEGVASWRRAWARPDDRPRKPSTPTWPF